MVFLLFFVLDALSSYRYYTTPSLIVRHPTLEGRISGVRRPPAKESRLKRVSELLFLESKPC